MAIALVVKAAAGSTNSGASVTTSGVDTTGASLLVAMVSALGGATDYSLTDSKSNTWTPLTAYGTTNAHARIFYCAGGTVGSGHTFTVTSTSGTAFPSVGVLAFSGTAASPLDTSTGNTALSAGSIAPGSISPSEDNEVVVVTLAAPGTTPSLGITGGFGGGDEVEFLSSNHIKLVDAFLIQTTAAAANPTWSWTSVGRNCASAIACFKAAAAGGGVVKTINGLAIASVKTFNGLAIASVKTLNGAATQ